MSQHGPHVPCFRNKENTQADGKDRALRMLRHPNRIPVLGVVTKQTQVASRLFGKHVLTNGWVQMRNPASCPCTFQNAEPRQKFHLHTQHVKLEKRMKNNMINQEKKYLLWKK